MSFANGLICFLVLVMTVGYIVWQGRRSRFLLSKWANESGIVLIEAEERTLLLGPFWSGTSNGQTVFRVRVRDRVGAEHSGWVRCGSWLLGIQTDRVEVRWDGSTPA